jgi:hypothetical protein
VFQIRSLSDHVREHVELIRSAYHDLWNFTIQWILIVLTVIATAFATVQLLSKREVSVGTGQETQRAEQGKSSP